jgi:hypothetical protein
VTLRCAQEGQEKSQVEVSISPSVVQLTIQREEEFHFLDALVLPQLHRLIDGPLSQAQGGLQTPLTHMRKAIRYKSAYEDYMQVSL